MDIIFESHKLSESQRRGNRLPEQIYLVNKSNIKIFCTEKSANDFIGKFYQTLQEKLSPILKELFYKIEKEDISKSFYKSKTTLTSNVTKILQEKLARDQYSL